VLEDVVATGKSNTVARGDVGVEEKDDILANAQRESGACLTGVGREQDCA